MSFRKNTDKQVDGKQAEDEFKLSVAGHAVTSGRDANCFFQSFFHTLTHQPPEVLNEIENKYPVAIKAFVDTFNSKLSFEPPLSFGAIMDISRQLHPLERECVFGPILRHTYNAMVESKLLNGSLLKLRHDAILWSDQTEQFANAFGAEYRVYMNQREFAKAKAGMPKDVRDRIAKAEFKVEEDTFYQDCNPNQRLANGKIFNLNIVYADWHLNYTLGERELNEIHRNQIITKETEHGGIYARFASPTTYAPLAKENLNFLEMRTELFKRFILPSQAEKGSQRSSTTFIAEKMQFLPQPSESKSMALASEPQSPVTPSEQPSETSSPSPDLSRPTHRSVRR